jgi:hypothetical protein
LKALGSVKRRWTGAQVKQFSIVFHPDTWKGLFRDKPRWKVVQEFFGERKKALQNVLPNNNEYGKILSRKITWYRESEIAKKADAGWIEERDKFVNNDMVNHLIFNFETQGYKNVHQMPPPGVAHSTSTGASPTVEDHKEESASRRKKRCRPGYNKVLDSDWWNRNKVLG